MRFQVTSKLIRPNSWITHVSCRDESRFWEEMEKHIDLNNSTHLWLNTANRWTGIRLVSYLAFFGNFIVMMDICRLPRWLSWLRHSVHRPVRSVGGAGVQSLGRPVDFVFRFQGRML